MTPARFHTIEEIYRAALDREPDQVSAFLDTVCEGDEHLRRKVEALLSSRQRASSFIETSAIGLATKIIENGQADFLVGQTFGHYKISQRIGTGGMGEVYLATDVIAGRKAALKLLPFRFTGDAERLERFRREARAVVALNHPNILTVYEIGQDHSTHYIASELIGGETLRQRLDRGRLQVSEALEMAIQIASALAAAHDAGVVHRDIKPENIMLRPDGYLKVLDFGVAKLAEQEAPATTPKEKALLMVETNLGVILGTVRYMSPEQASGAQVDKRTDIWSLGVILYEMVTGHTPFTGETTGEIITSILEKEPPLVANYVKQTPLPLQQVINKALRKDRTERYPSAAEMVQALKNLRRKLEFKAELTRSTILPPWLRWARSPVVLGLVLLVFAFALALPRYGHRNVAMSSPPEKSIAVLPLENLSDEKDTAFFASGVHDELVSDLSKIKDLKVISRTSVLQYRSDIPRNVREIGRQLGVAHVLEGTVQRIANRVKVSAQLIDARTDAHLWSQTYDRDLTDVFAIQSDIARTIADQLEAKLSPAEKAAITEPPTRDLAAYALYARANEIDVWGNWESAEKSLNQKVELLEKATQRDPNFALAYCALAKARCYLFSDDRQQLELAKNAAEAALRVRPHLGEAHLELARYYYYAGDFDRARDELAVTRRTLPNNVEALVIEARIGRRQNGWDAGLANLKRALELDPHNVEIIHHLRVISFEMRRYDEVEQLMTRETATGTPEELRAKMVLAEIKLAQGDPVPAQSILEQVPMEFSLTNEIWFTRFLTALYLRDYDAAERAIAATPATYSDVFGGQPPQSWADGQVARARGDKQKATAVFSTARNKMEITWGNKAKDAQYFAEAARLDAGLGRKEEAIREALRAIDLEPIAKESVNGPGWIINLALVYAWTGERDRALEELERVATIPAGPTYGDLLLNPCWDDLRGDPRFDKIVAAAKAASRYVVEPLQEKSIAVLPFENLTKDEENAFFAAGVQGEILTNLAKIADLRVISQTSVMQYKSGAERNLREIAKALGVSHVVEGSVQRLAGRVRVNAQLLDARSDRHLWAEKYDRDVTDLFAIQTEIAQQIASQLRARLSAAEKAAIAERPTADVAAYALYTEAKGIEWYDWEGADRSVERKVKLLEKAVQRDPNFALAYAALAGAQFDIFHSAGRSDLRQLELAMQTAETALRLQPDLGEAHLVLAQCYYHANLETGDFDRVRDELVAARRTLPNDSEATSLAARVDKRQHRWEDALANLRKASELDPAGVEVTYTRRRTLLEMRRYHEWEQALARDVESGAIKGPRTQLYQADFELAQGDPVAAQAYLAQVPLEFSPFEWVWRIRFEVALCLRDYNGAAQVIAATPAKFAHVHHGQPPESWADGQVARARGDKQKALAAFAAARKHTEATWGDKPKASQYFSIIAALDAGLGRKEEAIREAQRAVELMPMAKDSYWGPTLVMNLALVYAWTGEQDRALDELEKVATIPNGPSYGELRFNPRWDDLRGDPRFDKIVVAAKAASR